MQESDCGDTLFEMPFASTARLLMLSGSNGPCSKEIVEDTACCEIVVLNSLGESRDRASEEPFDSIPGPEPVKNLSLSASHTIQLFKIVEPERFLPFPAPAPKLHYTTKWRRLTRRLYQTVVVY